MFEKMVSNGRSFALTILTLLIVSLLVALKAIDGGTYSTIITVTVGAYIVRAAVQDFAPETKP